MVGRREFFLASGALLASTVARAQQPGKLYRIGFLGAASPTPQILKVTLEPFREAMRERGWVEGTNYTILERWAGGRFERHEADAEELARLGVDAFLMAQAPAVKAAIKATRTIPIIMVAPGDPVDQGLIASYARPGGNVTGLSDDAGVTPFVKQIDFLRQMVKDLSRLGILTSDALAGSRPEDLERRRLFYERIRNDFGIVAERHAVREMADVEPAFAMMKKSGIQSVVVAADGMLIANTSTVAQLALKHRLPMSSQWTGFPPAGGLLSYSADFADQYRRAAGYVDKIFRGANPAELPVERPIKFRLIVNLKTAKTLGLTVPQAVLLVADEVIE